MFIAVNERDIFVMQNLVFVYAVVFVMLNIVIDLTIAWLDPRNSLPMSDIAAPLPDYEAIPQHGLVAHGARVAAFARRSPLSAFWGVIGALIIVMAVSAPLLALYAPLKADFRPMTKPPTERHYFGTDQIGRDDVEPGDLRQPRVADRSRCRRWCLGTTFGAFWGLAADTSAAGSICISQRIMEFLQSFPDLILAMAIAMALGAGFGTVIVAIAITQIPFGGRVIRAVVLSLKEMSYVEAARGLGASHMRMMLRHILPQCVAPYLILATTHLGVAIIIEASLGFLGVGIPPPTPTWGNMLAELVERRAGAPVVAGAVSRRRDHTHRPVV